MPLTGERKRLANQRGKAKMNEKSRAELAAILDNLIDDVDVIVTKPRGGKQRVTFDMGKDTQAALELVAAAQGTTLDAVLRDVIDRQLTIAAKLQQLKRREQRAAAREEQRAETAAKIAEVLADKARVEAAIEAEDQRRALGLPFKSQLV